jgi:hypothetical protein
VRTAVRATGAADSQPAGCRHPRWVSRRAPTAAAEPAAAPASRCGTSPPHDWSDWCGASPSPHAPVRPPTAPSAVRRAQMASTRTHGTTVRAAHRKRLRGEVHVCGGARGVCQVRGWRRRLHVVGGGRWGLEVVRVRRRVRGVRVRVRWRCTHVMMWVCVHQHRLLIAGGGGRGVGRVKRMLMSMTLNSCSGQGVEAG